MGWRHCAGFAILSARSAQGVMFNYHVVGKIHLFFIWFFIISIIIIIIIIII